MNLSGFLAEVDKNAHRMSKEQLLIFVHEIARTLPQSGRTDFLKCLDGILKENKENGKSKKKTEEKEKGDIYRGWKEIKAQLDSIENKELCLDSYLNEEYDDWYSDEGDEFCIEDPNGVLDVLQKAFDFLHQSIDCEEYALGYEAAKRLMCLEIEVEGDYQEFVCEPLKIDSLEDYLPGNLDYNNMVVDALYLAYCANVLTERADALYRIFENSGRDGITFEMVMQGNEELPEVNDFLKLWIKYLGGIKSGKAERLIQEALGAINEKFVIRSRIALMLSEAVLKKGCEKIRIKWSQPA